MDHTVDMKYVRGMFDLTGKVAIITGGAGALGEAIAQGYAAYGADVVVTGRTLKTLEKAVKAVEDLGRKALAVICDVSKEEDVVAMVEKTMKAFGRVDILVTVAGLAKRHPAEDFPVEDFDQVMDINVRGTFLPCKHVGKIFKQQGYGKIVTISSVRAFCRPSRRLCGLWHQQGRGEPADQATGDRVGQVSHQRQLNSALHLLDTADAGSAGQQATL